MEAAADGSVEDGKMFLASKGIHLDEMDRTREEAMHKLVSSTIGVPSERITSLDQSLVANQSLIFEDVINDTFSVCRDMFMERANEVSDVAWADSEDKCLSIIGRFISANTSRRVPTSSASAITADKPSRDRLVRYSDTIRKTANPDDLPALLRAAGGADVAQLWSVVRAVCENTERRSTPGLNAHSMAELTRAVRGSLEHHFMLHMRSAVRGLVGSGSTGVDEIVSEYISTLKLPQGVEVSGGEATWVHAYLLLRCGATKECVAFLRSQKSRVSTTLVEAAESVCRSGGWAELNEALVTEWSTFGAGCQDPYKKAVYAILGRIDPKFSQTSVAPTLSDHIWVRLAALDRTDIVSELEKLRAYFDRYGESYFTAGSKSARLWHHILLCTLQFERAVISLAENPATVPDAAHIAVVLAHWNLLKTGQGAGRVACADGAGVDLAELLARLGSQLAPLNAEAAVEYFRFLEAMDDKARYGATLIAQSPKPELFIAAWSAPQADRKAFTTTAKALPRDVCRRVLVGAGERMTDSRPADAVRAFEAAGHWVGAFDLLSRIIFGVLAIDGPERVEAKRLATTCVERARSTQLTAAEAQARAGTLTMLAILDALTKITRSECMAALAVLDDLAILPTGAGPAPASFGQTMAKLHPAVQESVPVMVAAVTDCIDALWSHSGADGQTQLQRRVAHLLLAIGQGAEAAKEVKARLVQFSAAI
ncbi:Nucleoporin interacting component Nup93/Nic96 [Carpediemonas membranifera]|uniref:Nuclear pore protein n=1 Tax=Carpediemonas membranifera TaxID=201153 RepID=A0A8J6EAS3_9EUKA|nr:Nucleoporin interacting component Nup93/Nic96 [Carpediemonas membranifera]|eukprot:KAG9395230.1 Nucleoporin interacting component Nup93/Nic96 [Carpediemonas membranifera]